MREFHGGDYDVAVIGAGHAGIEAALAAARIRCPSALRQRTCRKTGRCAT